MSKHVINATIYNKKGRILSQATNNYLVSHPMQAAFARQAGMPDRIYLHAEIAALTRLRKDDRPYRITVERYKKDGTPGCAAPCVICQAALKHYGIKRVEYTL